MIKLECWAEISKEEFYKYVDKYNNWMEREELFYQLCMYGWYDDYEANAIIEHIEKNYKSND